ncbi:hypothetical protein [Streptomyces sp. NPDC056670]|uniref:hypothetical protein n=1 Tax=Streptomyces sp. NPDC056670 TaxID=3345904 RepID=UPI0036C369A0
MSDDITALLARRFSWPDGSGVLLAGSTAEGVAMRGSNVNVLVLDAPDDWLPADDGTESVVRPMSLARNYLCSRDPVINMDILRSEPLRSLAELATGMARIQDPLTPDLELPVLDALEMRFLSRLRSGRIVSGAPAVEHWRQRTQVRWLPEFHCATTYLTADHFRRKAMTAHADQLPVDASVLLRLTVEHLLISALAGCGHVLHEVKNLGRNITSVLASGTRGPRLFEEAESLLEHGMKPTPELFAWIDACSADLLRWLPSSTHGRSAAAYLAGQGYVQLAGQGYVQEGRS